MAIPIDPGSKTLLGTIAGYFYEASRGVKGAGQFLKGIPVIGEGVWVYFYNAGQFLWWIGDRVVDFDKVFSAVRDFAVKLEQQQGVKDLISAVWTEFNAIRTDPIGYIKGKLYSLSGHFKSIVDDAALWVKDRVRDADADLKAIIDTGAYWIKDKLSILYPELPKIATDPLGYVKGLIENNVPLCRYLFTDTSYWLKLRLSDILGLPMTFFYDPWGFITQKTIDMIESSFDRYRTQIYRLGEYILRRLWEGV